VTPQNFGIQSNISSKLLKLETSNFVHRFVLGKLIGHRNKFPQKGRGLGYMTPKMFGIQLNISSILHELERNQSINQSINQFIIIAADNAGKLQSINRGK